MEWGALELPSFDLDLAPPDFNIDLGVDLDLDATLAEIDLDAAIEILPITPCFGEKKP